MRAHVISRVLENRALRRENPNWRKEAGGQGIYKQIRQAKQRARQSSHVGVDLAKLQSQAKAYQAKRKEMVAGLSSVGKTTKPTRQRKPRRAPTNSL